MSQMNEPGLRCSNDLAEVLTSLRRAQKQFFSAKPQSPERTAALIESKRIEKVVDEFLTERALDYAPAQKTLFDGQV